jgi:prevent-host-death family protein
MTVTTLSSREFNQDVGRAKRASEKGPVFITHLGKPSQVLLSIEEYERLTHGKRSLMEALYMPGMEDIDFDPPKANFKWQIPDFDE